jgi:general secretion pathway protein H
MRRARSSRQAGFSLLELLVALTILALALSVVSLSASRRSPAFEVRRVSGETVSLLREARLTARSSGRPVRIAFDPEAREVRRAGADPLVVPQGVELSLVSAASAGPSAIVFFPDGSSSGGAFTFEGAGRKAEVTVDWLTSRVERLEKT